jgi:hypothetical protein
MGKHLKEDLRSHPEFINALREVLGLDPLTPQLERTTPAADHARDHSRAGSRFGREPPLCRPR